MIGFRDTCMNEFRTNMINKNLLKPDSKVGLKQIKDLIFNSDITLKKLNRITII